MDRKNFIRTAAVIVSAIAVLSQTSCNRDNDIIDDNPDGNNPPSGQTGTFRPADARSSAYCDRVYDWTPAPGQFINDPTGGQQWDADMTSEIAADIALSRLQKRYTVSLGSFGGYIVVGFDHSIANNGDYEIGIFGNAFTSNSGSSNEPGIVYVMQDTNGNGLPDDEWYELSGSDTFAESTVRGYSVTYYRPSGDRQPVRWTDSLGKSGEVAYVESFHSQPTYYPVWIKSDSYTLSGTLLKARGYLDEASGQWFNPAFGWGYADNMGDDVIEFDGVPDCNRFRISDAIDSDGKSVSLKYIDFVKIQTAMNAQSGWLGDVSTEIMGVVDLTLKRK